MTTGTSLKTRKGGLTARRLFLIATSFTSALSAASGPVNAGERVTHSPVDQLKWLQTPSGREVSLVAGDIEKGPHTTFVKFAPGMKTEPHTHSHEYYGIVVKGVARHYEPGRKDSQVVLHAGSHWAVPANIVHVSECLPDSECVFAISQEAFFDFKPAN